MNFIKEKVYLIVASITVVSALFINSQFKDTLPRKLSEAVFWVFLPIIFFSVISIFLESNLRDKWKKITNYYLIASFVLVGLSSTTKGGLDFFSLTKEISSITLAVIYSIIFFVLLASGWISKK